MSSKLGIVGICGMSVGVVAVDNVSNGIDPFPAMVAGGLFTAGCVGIGEIDVELGAAIAWVFLLSNILLKSDSLLKIVGGVTAQTSKLNSTTNSVHASVYHMPKRTNTVRDA